MAVVNGASTMKQSMRGAPPPLKSNHVITMVFLNDQESTNKQTNKERNKPLPMKKNIKVELC
jgi:hypothetical protein